MTYKEAKSKMITKRIIGIIVMVVFLCVVLTSLLRELYYIPSGGIFFRLSYLIKNLIFYIYQNVPFIPFLWEVSPDIELTNIFSSSNINFLVCYASMILGMLIFQSGNAIGARLKIIERTIQDRQIIESLEPGPKRSVSEMRENVEITAPSLWEMFHNSYVAPLVVAIISGFIIFLFGWN